MEKIIFFVLVIPIMAYVLYLGGMAIMNGFKSKEANRAEKKEKNETTEIQTNSDSLINEITKFVPNFKIIYKPDFRQKIADSWPHSISDNDAKNDWGWKAEYDLHNMTKDMMLNLRKINS